MSQATATNAAGELPAYPTLGEATAVWARIGFLSFGGPAGQIALMHRELVEERRWISDSRFLHALNFCMLLPGPEAQQLATYVGWLLHGVRGGVIAGTLFVLPGLLTILVLSGLYAAFHETGWLGSLFFGLKAAVLAIVVEAVLRVGRRALKSWTQVAVAAAAFIALFAFNVPFPLVVLGAGLCGLAATLAGSHAFTTTGHRKASEDRPALIGEDAGAERRVGIWTLAGWIVLWLAPLAIVVPVLGWESTLATLWLFFSQMAMVTFGGAYAVLAYVAQEAVQQFGWLQPGEMVDGLALAETTPGPLVLVLSFAGFMASFRASDGLDPFLAGALGASLTAWVTFVPCFLWIFAGAPHIERLRTNKVLSGALAAITAAVVGVILNLALWFGLHVLFRDVGTVSAGPLRVTLPAWASLDLTALALSIVAVLALFRFRLGILPTLALCGVLGLGLQLLLPTS